jgi:crossover junction endodeoxyribonuclease RuvC
MIIMGIDPSLQSMGCAVIDYSHDKFSFIASSTIKTKSDTEMYLRIKYISEKLKSIIKTYKPKIIAMEETFVNSNPSTSLKLGMVRGACYVVASDSNLQIKEYQPRLVKKSITGSGSAEKSQVSYMINHIMTSAKPKNLDESDAIAVAITLGLMMNLEK